MIKKKILWSIALIIILSLVLAGCGNSRVNKPAKPVSVDTNDYSQLVDQAKESAHYKFFAANVAAGPEGTKKAHYSTDCISCHSEVKINEDPGAQLSDFFPGGKYQSRTEGVTCDVCHVLSSNGIKLKKTGWDTCGGCHTAGSKPTLGKEVHHPQYEMIKGVGVGDVPDMPSYKYLNMDDFTCFDCHETNASKHDFMVPGVTVTHNGVNRIGSKLDGEKFKTLFSQTKCEYCHVNPQDTYDSVKNKQAYVVKKLGALKPVYVQWSKKANTMDSNDPKVKAFREGATYYSYVANDGSKGVHNFEFTKKLLAKAEEKFSLLQ